MHKILELYSGIGGMHTAWRESGLSGDVVAAVDINTIANDVYKFNYPETTVWNKNIQSVTPSDIVKLNINTILMSPPCQPFTRNGKFLDQNDARTNSFIYLLEILEKLKSVEYILLENVKGFECSAVRNLFISKLEACNFEYQEVLLCPSSFGMPNSRLRYYCLARRTAIRWNIERKQDIVYNLTRNYGDTYALENILENRMLDEYLISEKILKRAKVLDICHKDSKRSCCFTKAYSHYVEGTGSVFTEKSPEVVKHAYEKANKFEIGSKEYINSLKILNLRFFTPREILSIMGFPKEFSFPENITRKQCYRLLGNSVNVKVISEIMKILFDNK